MASGMSASTSAAALSFTRPTPATWSRSRASAAGMPRHTSGRAAFSAADRLATVGLDGRTGKAGTASSGVASDASAGCPKNLARVKPLDLVGEALFDHAAFELQRRRHLALLVARQLRVDVVNDLLD